MKTPKKQNSADSVCVIGLGYVGLTLATVFAEEGNTVIGVDYNEKIIKMLEEGVPHFYEPGLKEKLAQNKEHLKFSKDLSEASSCNIYIIAVGTNITENNKLDYTHVNLASKAISKILKKGDLVLLRSTVMIGTTRNKVIPILEKGSKIKAGKDFFVAFAPERTVEGKALEELRTLPQVIGGFTKECANRAEKLFSTISPHIVIAETLEESELTKLISNAYRDLTFAFANSLALIAYGNNVNINSAIAAANDGYERNRIPLPSPGVGGYCLTKDPYLLAESSVKYKQAGKILKEGRVVNAAMPAHVVNVVDLYEKTNKFKQHKSVAVIGLAFKGNPPTSDVRYSPSEDVIKELKKRGYKKIYAYDPNVDSEVFKNWKIEKCSSLEDAIEHGDTVILMHNNQQYKNLNFSAISDGSSKKLILDPWGLYNYDRSIILNHGLDYANLSYCSFLK